MAGKYVPTAKDKAFAAERTKLQHQIQELKKEVKYWRDYADRALETSAQFETYYFDLLKELDISDGDFKAHLERVKKTEETLAPLRALTSMGSMLHGYY